MSENVRRRLLVVGPLPPPLGGTTVSFQIFCSEFQKQAETWQTVVIDSSPKRFKSASRSISLNNLRDAWRVFWQFSRQVRNVDRALVFGSNGFLLSMAPLLLMAAKIALKPCYIRAFGGSLDRFCDELRPWLRWLLLSALNNSDGLIVQTELLYHHFRTLIGDDKVHLVPGYRYIPASDEGRSFRTARSDGGLRLVFLGHVREEKGVYVLLESLRGLDPKETRAIHCDILGPISGSRRFQDELTRTENASYEGVLEPQQAVPTLRNYDALVYPTFYQGEGHPGVVIEAMMAGIPVISTAFRSIPELVQDGVNGLLVPPQDARSLTEAIRTLFNDRQLLAEMAERNWERRTRYDAHNVVPLFSEALGL